MMKNEGRQRSLLATDLATDGGAMASNVPNAVPAADENGDLAERPIQLRCYGVPDPTGIGSPSSLAEILSLRKYHDTLSLIHI